MVFSDNIILLHSWMYSTCTQEGYILRPHNCNCDKMANQLTHGLFAGAVMALLNPLFGMETVSWNIFLAGIIGMLMNVDYSGCRVFKGSPMGHSLGAGAGIVYLVAMAFYFGHAFFGLELLTGMIIALAIGVGIFTHLATEFATGQQIFTIPNNLKAGRWFMKVDASSDKFWASWGRARLSRPGLRDSHMNAISLACMLFAIGIF